MQPLQENSVAEPAAVTTAAPGRWQRFALAGVIVLAIAGFYLLGLQRYLSWDYVRGQLDAWQEATHANLPLALLLFFLVYAGVTALSLPVATALGLLAGALFGRWLGTAAVSAASTLGATLAFLSSRYLLRDWVQQRYGERLAPLNQGIEQDGAFYLFTLRLVPAVPFFLINLGMGLTPIRTRTYVGVSWLGMLLGTFLYVNAGTALGSIDTPGEALSPGVLVALALLGIVPLGMRKLMQWQVRWRHVGIGLVALLVVALAGAGLRTHLRYQTADSMLLPVREYSNAEYPEDPANRSLYHGQYKGRQLQLVRKDDTHFDFILEPLDSHVARVVFRDVDVSLMTPSLPEWTKADEGLRRIALTDRQWNRQQVRFDRNSPHLEVTGGDGYETANLYTAELAKNCLNAGLWEVLLFFKDGNEKALYYQGWFTFPLGHYKDIFERQTGLAYVQNWYYLEHWFDPAGTPVPMEKLRRVTRERQVSATLDWSERILARGEQARKRRTTMADNVRTWGDFYADRRIRFASFIPPGRYSVQHPWKNEYRRMDRLDRAMLRAIVSPATERPLHELELVFSSSRQEGSCRFFVSGFDLAALPQLSVDDYPRGLYMPMGIGVPPFFQGYDDLHKNPPTSSPYVSVLLDAEERWIDHHRFAIDGPVLHRDAKDAECLHLYLLSYERHSLIAHFFIDCRTLQ